MSHLLSLQNILKSPKKENKWLFKKTKTSLWPFDHCIWYKQNTVCNGDSSVTYYAMMVHYTFYKQGRELTRVWSLPSVCPADTHQQTCTTAVGTKQVRRWTDGKCICNDNEYTINWHTITEYWVLRTVDVLSSEWWTSLIVLLFFSLIILLFWWTLIILIVIVWTFIDLLRSMRILEGNFLFGGATDILIWPRWFFFIGSKK